MDSACGPPAKMVERRDELTPMLSQYLDLCERYDEALVLFQVGDFYEAFCEAAEVISRLLEITLTKREDSTGRYAMAGIPVNSAESYIEELLDAGFRVAIADQVQDPEEASGVVDRAVTRIVTPGTLTEDELLDGDENNYVACLTGDGGLALLDVSTGDFYVTSGDSVDAIRGEIGRFEPAEAVVGPDVSETDLFGDDCMVTPFDEEAFELESARDRVAAYFRNPDAVLGSDAEIRACGALLAYAEYTRGGQDGRLDYLNHVTRYDPREYVLLDAVALRSLEVFERRAVGGDDDATLLGVLDETATAPGRRTLADWLRRPLLDADRIDARHEAVAELKRDVRTRETTHERLRDVYDIERLIGRVARGRANARDLQSLRGSLDVVPDLRALLAETEAPILVELRADLDEMADVRELIGRAICEDPPREITDGNVIAEGYDDRLDELRVAERDGKEWIETLEATERERTGIDSLKVGYNEVHGYYIEVTNPNLDRVPDEYTRRQTLKNAERFYTPELKEREEEIIQAGHRADDLEYDLFRDVRSAVADEAERVQLVASAISELDVLVSFAEVAATHGYVRPEIGAERFEIESGRHPVVERTQEGFVPNDTWLGRGPESADEEPFLAIITGPNMSGKSTYLRQVALISVLAQAGSFVPAASARLPTVDRVFTRIGASDDIAGGHSTFMVEMTEVAEILRAATENSLVLLDEVGRGTSTRDGLAIARAIVEHLHDEIGATTLFATHHHELTTVEEPLTGVVNRHFDARRIDGGVRFEHELSPGPAAASYGVEVAGEAGIPERVVDRGRELLTEGDSQSNPSEFGGGKTTDRHRSNGVPPEVEAVLDELQGAELANTTPIEALTLLHRLQGRLDD